MPRPPLPIGTWGKIRRDQLGTNRWRARTNFRDYDGETRLVVQGQRRRPAPPVARQTGARAMPRRLVTYVSG
jgi:hypothetical protein